jgi:hypothetical protein
MSYFLCNLFCRLAGNLEEERQSFYDAVAACNEKESMPRGILFAPLSIGSYGPERRPAVDENIRVSQYFLLVVEDIWEAPVQSFLHDYRLAAKCRADAGLPMRDVAVLLKPTPADEEPGDGAKFRSELEAGGIRSHQFANVADFRAILAPLLSEWLVAVADAHAAG